MGRDLRQTGYNRNRYPDRCVYYGKECINNGVVIPNAKPLGRFYKRDAEAFAWKYQSLGNGQFSSSMVFEGKIETLDNVSDLRPDMYVVDQTGMLFVIVPPVVSDDADQSKVIGTRPSVKTTMTLRGLEIIDE